MLAYLSIQMVDLLYHNTYCNEEISENDINTLKKWAINTPSKSSFGLPRKLLEVVAAGTVLFFM